MPARFPGMLGEAVSFHRVLECYGVGGSFVTSQT